MKKLSILITGFLLAFCFVANLNFAQSKIHSEKFIILELIIPDEGLGEVVRKLKVPISKNLERIKIKKDSLEVYTKDKHSSFEVTSTDGATVECENCPLTSEFKISSVAKFIDENETGVFFILSFKNQKRCNEAKQFQAIPGKQNNLELKCKVKIKAYYEENRILLK